MQGGPRVKQSFSNHENNEEQISESHIWNHPPPYSHNEQGKLMCPDFLDIVSLLDFDRAKGACLCKREEIMKIKV